MGRTYSERAFPRPPSGRHRGDGYGCDGERRPEPLLPRRPPLSPLPCPRREPSGPGPAAPGAGGTGAGATAAEAVPGTRAPRSPVTRPALVKGPGEAAAAAPEPGPPGPRPCFQPGASRRRRGGGGGGAGRGGVPPSGPVGGLRRGAGGRVRVVHLGSPGRRESVGSLCARSAGEGFCAVGAHWRRPVPERRW